MVKKSDIAKAYRQKYGFEIPSRRLAKLMAEENPIFRNIDDARDVLRYIEGKRGESLRKYAEKMDIVRDLNPYKLPEFEDRKREIFVLPTVCDNILVLPDLHCPYTHTPSLNKAIKHGLDNEINTILLLGDVLDNHNISSYCQDPTRRNQEEEFLICKEMLKRFRDLFPKATIYWLKGNHDIRWERYIQRFGKDISQINHFRMEEVLRLHEEGIVTIDDKTLVRAGNFYFHHGHQFFGRFAPANPAKALWDKVNLDIMIGHCHSHTSYEKVTPTGIRRTFILGCLSEIGMSVDYNPIVNQYRRGFAHVRIKGDSYDAQMIRGVED